ncbi:MAG TPA: hypothetical protein VIJ75_13380, partial [Hanamia sp.]
MTKNLGWIRNPLTIIGIFSTITEALCIVIVPQVTERNQDFFIWFVILFPTFLLILFFYTLIKHNTKLYAPGDFSEDKLEFAALFLDKQIISTDPKKIESSETFLKEGVLNFNPFIVKDLEGDDKNKIISINEFFSKINSVLPKQRLKTVSYIMHNSTVYSLALVLKDGFSLNEKLKIFSISVFLIDEV